MTCCGSAVSSISTARCTSLAAAGEARSLAPSTRVPMSPIRGLRTRPLRPYHWYKQHVLRGAEEHSMPADYVKSMQAGSKEVGFAHDSAPERRGFELPVPLAKRVGLSGGTGGAAEAKKDCPESAIYPAGGGAEGSNPLPSIAWSEKNPCPDRGCAMRG